MYMMFHIFVLVGPKKSKKIIFVSFVHHFIFTFLGKINILKNHITFAHLIKGFVLGRMLWSVNTFPMRNRLPDPKSGFSQTLFFRSFLE